MQKTQDINTKLEFENQCLKKGYKLIAGIDEVGRGPLAGPVVCAAVILPLEKGKLIDGIDDSKKLSFKKREELSDKILERAIAVHIHEISPQVIDEINILQAVKSCMKICVQSLSPAPDIILSDALKIETDISQINIIKGDQKSYLIGAASIVAKVYRDKLMQSYHEKYKAYGFDAHKGYGTKAHIQKILELGPCEIHRQSFIKNYWAQAEKKPQQNT